MDNQYWLALAIIILGLVLSLHNYFDHGRSKLTFLYQIGLVASFPLLVLYHNSLLLLAASALGLIALVRKGKTKKK